MRRCSISEILQRLDIDLGHSHYSFHHLLVLVRISTSHWFGQAGIIDLPGQTETIGRPAAYIIDAAFAQRGL